MWRQIEKLGIPLAVAVMLIGASGRDARGADEEQFVVIKARHVITMSGPELKNVDILLVGGKVRLVGTELSYPKSARVIDARDQVVMPGLIHPRSRWQLPDYSRGGVHGDWSAADEVFPDTLDWEPWLKAGFTAVCFYPAGTGIPGSTAVYRTGGPRNQRRLGAGYLRVTMTSRGGDKKTLRDAFKKAQAEIEKVEKARKEWEEKQKKDQPNREEKQRQETKKEDESTSNQEAPTAADDPDKPSEKEPEKKSDSADASAEFTPPKIDPAVLPLVRSIRDEEGLPFLYEVRSAADYLHWQDVIERAEGLPRGTLCLLDSRRSDMHYVLDSLGEEEPLVLLATGVGALPFTATRMNLAGELVLAGCKIVLMPSPDGALGLRDYRLHLGDLVRAGVPRDEVLQAVTLRAAELLGIDQRYGSIEKGKDADLIFLDGDPLDPTTEVQRVMSAGNIVWEAEPRS